MQAPHAGLIHMEGHYTSRVAIQHFPTSLVESWLPDAIELAPQAISPSGYHPVNLLFGIQSKVYFNINPLFKFKYQEFGLVVPYVQWKDPKYQYNSPFLFTPIIFVDNFLVSLGGEIVFGFPKRMAKFQVNDSHYAASDPEVNTPYVGVQYEKLSSTPDPVALTSIRDCLQQPSISQKRNGKFSESGFWWNLDTAEFNDLKLDGEIINYMLPGVRSGNTQKVAAEGTANFSDGAAFEMRTDWTLTLPTSDFNKDWAPWNGTSGGGTK